MSTRQQSAGTSGKSCDVGVNEKDLRLPMLKLKCKVSVEDDINQLFEDISIRTSKKSLDSLHEIGASPVRRNPLKKPITSGTPRSSGFGSTEAVSLKQALRELSISKASEAASRRLSRSSASPRVSESGKTKNMHNAVAGKDCPSSSRSKYGFMEVSAVPEKGKPNVSERLPDHFRIPKYKLLSQSCNSSPKFTMATPHDGAGTSLVRNETHFSSREVTSKTYKQERVPKNKLSRSPSVSSAQINHSIDEVRQSAVKASLSPKERIIIPYEESAYPVQALKLNSLNSNAQTASCFGVRIKPASSMPTVIKNNVSSALESVESKYDPHYSSSIGVPILQNNIVYPLENVGSVRSDHSTSKLYVATKQNSPPVVMEENESVSSSALTDIDITDQAKVGKHTSAFSTIYSSENGGNIVDRGGNDATLSRMPENALQQRLQQDGSFQPTAYASGIGNRVSKLPRGSNSSAKPVTRYMIVIKKKVKWRPTVRSVAGKDAKTNRSVDHASQLVCQRCNCVLNLNKGSYQRSTVFKFSGSKAEVSSTRINPGLSTPHFNLKSYKTVVERKDFKSKGKGEFSQSSGSIGEYCRTSTSMDYDSNASSSTCQNKPHMSKDVRWAAIRNAKMQQGNLDLGHFNLLKKLGRGDIGTVYLSELIGSNCFFAIKVMDNEFLARRKKMLRARIERDILSMLDHPFLPTLYAQFTSNNMSCLVMEYCPGGDLHVLRQKQSNKRFSETAARFYVAEVLLALEYLHMLGIVYRDLKPENVLVREDGHIMLTDFDLSLTCDVSPSLLQSSSADMDPARMSGPCASSGCIAPFCSEQSCQMSCFSPRFLPVTAKSKKSKANLTGKVGALPQLVAEPTEARSNSFVGTHEYLAPEIIRSEGHGAAVDWWTLGVFLYELLYGKTPFKGSGNKDTLANAVLRGLKFPSIPFVSSQARDLIRGLLVKDPEHRLGSVKGAAEIKRHPFFRGLNWALIRCAVPPGLPESYGLGSRYGS